VEIIDPDTGEPIEEPTESDRGALVITNLVNKGSVYIRINIEDIGWVRTAKCNCGRTHPRIDQLDRASFLVRVGGRRLTTTAVRNAVEKVPELYTGDFAIVRYAPVMDKLKLKIAPSIPPSDPGGWSELEERTREIIRRELGVDAEIQWVKYEELPVIGWKIRRIIEA
jgi:phenylacetate-CoA ligase